MTDKPSLNIQDIINVISIIDVCVKRGAIEGGELTAVGNVRDKFAAFVEANTKKDDVADTETEQETDA